MSRSFLASSISIPTSVSKIGGGCFGECKSMTSISIPTSVTYIGEYCFSKCSSLTSISIPRIFKSEIEDLFKEHWEYGGIPNGCQIRYEGLEQKDTLWKD